MRHTKEEVKALLKEITEYIREKAYEDRYFDDVTVGIAIAQIKSYASKYASYTNEYYFLTEFYDRLKKVYKNNEHDSVRIINHVEGLLVDAKSNWQNKRKEETKLREKEKKEEIERQKVVSVVNREKIEETKLRDSIINRVAYLSQFDREDLIKIEEAESKMLRDKTSVFGQADASGRIVGSLNRGMYECTRGEMVDLLKDDGIKIKSDDRFIDYMSDGLLRARITGIEFAIIYCNKTKGIIAERAEEIGTLSATADDYTYMRMQTKHLGEVIKNMYEEYNGITPFNEIKENAIKNVRTRK